MFNNSEKKNNILQYIENLQSWIKTYNNRINGLNDSLFYTAPELQMGSYIGLLNLSISNHTKRIEALEKIQNNESISQESYDLLMEMKVFQDDPVISGYNKIDSEATHVPCL